MAILLSTKELMGTIDDECCVDDGCKIKLF